MVAAPLTLHQMAALSFLPGGDILLQDVCFSHQKLYLGTGQLAQVGREYFKLLQRAKTSQQALPPGQAASNLPGPQN